MEISGKVINSIENEKQNIVKNIISGFDLEKAHVKNYTKVSKTGKTFQVKEHEDKRKSKDFLKDPELLKEVFKKLKETDENYYMKNGKILHKYMGESTVKKRIRFLLRKKRPDIQKLENVLTKNGVLENHKSFNVYYNGGIDGSKTLKRYYEVLNKYPKEKRLALTLILSNRQLNGASLTKERFGYENDIIKEAAKKVKQETIDKYNKVIKEIDRLKK